MRSRRARAAVSGPGRGYTIDLDAPRYVIGGDETAIPAVTQLLEEIPERIPTAVHLELGDPDAWLDLGVPANTIIEWHDLEDGAPPGDALLAAMRAAAPTADDRVWVAGEAAAVQRVRKLLFEELHIPRSQTAIRGYWKHGRAGDSGER